MTWSQDQSFEEDCRIAEGGLCLAELGSVDDGINTQITLAGGRRADVVGFVGLSYVASVTVGIGIDGDRLYSHVAACCRNAHGYFAAVGDQDFSEHSAIPGHN